MYSYDWIVLVTLGLDRWRQTRQLPHHRQAAHEIEFEAAQQRHRDLTKAANATKAPQQNAQLRAGSLFAGFRHLRAKGFGRPRPVSDRAKPQACLASEGEACCSDRAAS